MMINEFLMGLPIQLSREELEQNHGDARKSVAPVKSALQSSFHDHLNLPKLLLNYTHNLNFGHFPY